MQKCVNWMFAVLCIGALAGCSSMNVRTFRADSLHTPMIQKSVKNKVSIQPVTVKGEDPNSIMCRMAGNIYLPQKQTYSQYVGEAFLPHNG